MDLGISGLRVVVTAGAEGIGRKITDAFVREGARVFVCDISDRALKSLAGNPEIGACICDVSNEADVARMIGAAADHLEGIDCLVNNAGSFGPTAPASAISLDDWNKCIGVNLTGAFLCAREAIPHLKRSSNASIVSMSSAAGKMGYPNKAPYAAAKWGVIGLMKTLAIELGGDGIRCNTILPGPVEGAGIRRMIADKAALAGITPEEQTERYLALASIKAFPEPEEIADLVVFLSSRRCARISGQALGIDGDLQALV